MILRRITEHVKTQNWTAVALDWFICFQRDLRVAHDSLEKPESLTTLEA